MIPNVCIAPAATLDTEVIFTLVYSASLYPAPAVVISTPNATVRSAFNPPPLPPVNEIFAYCPFTYPEPLVSTVSPILSKTQSAFL